MLEGRHIYADAPPGINTWPPLFSLLCAPLTLLALPTPYLARGLWLLLNFALLLWILRWLARLVYGRDLGLRVGSDALSPASPELLIPLLLTVRYLQSNFAHLQVNLLIFALALGGLYLHATRRERAGGLALGCAAALKVMPVLFIPYLAYRGRWRAAAYTTAGALGFSLLPILVFGPTRFWEYVGAWGAVLRAGWGVGKMNQSVFAMFDRFIGHGMAPFTVEGVNRVPESGEPIVTVAVAVLLAAVVVLAGAIFRGRVRPDGWPALAEWSVVFVVSALFGPVAWKAYLVVLLLPNALLFAAWRSPRLDGPTRKGAGLVLLASFVFGVLTTRSLVGEELAGKLEMASVVTASGLILLGGLLWFRARCGAWPAAGGVA